MARRQFFWLVWITLWMVGGCATDQTTGVPTWTVGMGEAELVADQGQPQQIIPQPDGGKIFVYENRRLDQMAILGSGALGRPEQVYYWLDAQGKVEKAKYYPYGKKKVLFRTEPEPAQMAAAGASSATTPPPPAAAPLVAPPPQPLRAESLKPPAAPPPAAPAAIPEAPPATLPATPPPPPAAVPEKAAPVISKPSPPPASPKSMGEAAGLELRMNKAEVQRLLGLPDHTEGFWAEGKAVTVWSYKLADPKGQRVLPLVFENGVLSGWGDTYYQMVLRKVRSRNP